MNTKLSFRTAGLIAFRIMHLMLIMMMSVGSPLSVIAQTIDVEGTEPPGVVPEVEQPDPGLEWTEPVPPDAPPGSTVMIRVGDSLPDIDYDETQLVVVTITSGPISVAYPEGYLPDCVPVGWAWDETKQQDVWTCKITLDSDPAVSVGEYTYEVTQGDIIEYGFFTDGIEGMAQCANGSLGDEVCSWTSGNLGKSKSKYYEGDSIPYRLVMLDVPEGAHTVTIEWDTTKAGKHAIDYLTSWDRNVVFGSDPTLGLPGVFTTATYPIPADPQVADAGVTQIPGDFTMYNGTITAHEYYYSVGTGFDGDKSASIQLHFVVSGETKDVVLAWGGHISTRADWGIYDSVVNIPGSPYHTRLIEIDGKGGNQDLSLDAAAVIFPAKITIIKNAVPPSTQEFGFTASPLPLYDFTLVDNSDTTDAEKVFADIENFTTYTVIESPPSGWDLTDISCVADVFSSVGDIHNITLTEGKVDIELGEGDEITCTYTNEEQYGYVTVTKVVNNDHGGTALPDDFDLTLDDALVTSGEANDVLPGTYVIDETLLSGYEFDGVTGDCYIDEMTEEIKIDVALGESVSCTLTNSDIAPKLTLIKTVVGGTALPDDFLLTIGGLAATSGTPYEKMAGVAYAIDETDLTDYVFGGISGDTSCPSDLGGTVTLAVGDDVTCTITNYYIDIAIDKQISDDYDPVLETGTWYDEIPVLFAGTDLYYRFIITNTGQYELKNVEVTDPSLGLLLESNPDYVFCTYETLAVGEVVYCGPFGPIDAVYEMNNEICNIASAEGTARPGTGYSEMVSDSDEACYTPRLWAFTPGFWKNHTADSPSGHDAWQYTEYLPGDDLVFTLPAEILMLPVKGGLTTFGDLTLIDALRLRGGTSFTGALEILLRAATASLLNASFHEMMPDDLVEPMFPWTTAQVIEAVDAAITTQEVEIMLELATTLDMWNNGYEYFDWTWPVP